MGVPFQREGSAISHKQPSSGGARNPHVPAIKPPTPVVRDERGVRVRSLSIGEVIAALDAELLPSLPAVWARVLARLGIEEGR